MTDQDFEETYIKPIINACYPGTLAALTIAVLQVTGNEPGKSGVNPLLWLPFKYSLVLGALLFLGSAFAIFFHTVYPSRRRLWTLAALSFLLGLTCSFLAVLIFAIPER